MRALVAATDVINKDRKRAANGVFFYQILMRKVLPAKVDCKP